jgi:hypothetical protein
MDVGTVVDEQAGHDHVVALDRGEQRPQAHVVGFIHVAPFWWGKKMPLW